MPGEGKIMTEHTAWCSRCAFWFQWSEPTKKLFVQILRHDGWRKIKGKWVCPDCSRKDGD